MIIWHQQYFDVKVGATESMRNLISYQVQLEKKVFCFCLKSKLESCAAEQKKNTAKSISTINWSQQIHHLLHYKTVIILYSRKNPTDFKLSKCLKNLEGDMILNKMKNEPADENNNEIFKAILKEDWIPEASKESLKTLNDFMTYLIKSLKIVKSKIFYERICNYIKSLYE